MRRIQLCAAACAPGSPPPPPAAAPGYLLATVSNTWQVTRRRTRLERLQVRGAPAGASVGLACLRHRCRLRSRSATADARGFAGLTRMFRARTIRRGTVIEVRITAAGLIGKVVRYRIRRGHIPQGQVLCLAPGAASPQRC